MQRSVRDRRLCDRLIGWVIWSTIGNCLLPAIACSSSITLVRYDARGNGLSDWDVGDISFDAWVSDMETVVDAAGLDRFPLLGLSQGCAVSIAYAARHPDRVSCLILYGGFATGLNKRPNITVADRERLAAMNRLGP